MCRLVGLLGDEHEQQRDTIVINHGMIENQWRLDGIAPQVGQARNYFFHLVTVDPDNATVLVFDPISKKATVWMICKSNQMLNNAVFIFGECDFPIHLINFMRDRFQT